MTMPRPGFSIARADPDMRELIAETDQKTLAVWAIECAERVMPHFEKARPDDSRPRQALETLQKWIDTSEFSMSVIRGASLASHAAAREVGEDTAARSVARAAGQAVATAHVSTHAYGPAIYAQQAISRDTGSIQAAEK
jgi:hypothetical protein